MSRRRVSIRIEQLVHIHERRQPAFFTDWDCRLCPAQGCNIDRTAALDTFADHLAKEHRASGGYIRRNRDHV